MGCPSAGVGASWLVVHCRFPAVRLPISTSCQNSFPFAAQPLRRFLGQHSQPATSQARHCRLRALQPVSRGRLDQGLGRAHPPGLKSCQTVADQVWGGGRSGRIALGNPWRRAGCAVGWASIGEKPLPAGRFFRRHGPALAASPPLASAWRSFDSWPSWPPPPCLLVLFPAFLEIATISPVPGSEAHPAGSPRLVPGVGFTSKRPWPQWLFARRQP